MELSIFRRKWAVREQQQWAWMMPLSVAILAATVTIPIGAQEPSQPAESVADAARAARDQKAGAAKQAKVVTTDDLVPPPPMPADTGTPEPSKPAAGQTASTKPPDRAASNKAPGTPTAAQAQEPVEKRDCDNPDDERLKAELQSAQEERDQLRRELNADPAVISGGNVDLSNFKPGNSGVAFGSPPLSQTQPQSPARIQEVELNERIASLERAVKIACDSPEDAAIQSKIYEAERQLKMLQQEFDLDRTTYYSKPNYADDPAGKAKLDAEQQQIADVQSEIERLKQDLTVQPPE